MGRTADTTIIWWHMEFKPGRLAGQQHARRCSLSDEKNPWQAILNFKLKLMRLSFRDTSTIKSEACISFFDTLYFKLNLS
jgi:hypothetical protein